MELIRRTSGIKTSFSEGFSYFSTMTIEGLGGKYHNTSIFFEVSGKGDFIFRLHNDKSFSLL